MGNAQDTGAGEHVVDYTMDIDEAALEERAEPAAVDRTVRLLARENRFALRAGPASWNPLGNGQGVAVDISLRCVAHRHPECRLRWVRVSVDVSGSDGTVLDLSPRDEVATDPVRVSTRYGGGLSLQIETVPLGPEVTVERAREQDVFFPRLTSSGPMFAAAWWDFLQVGEAPLHVDRTLRLLAGLPDGATQAHLHTTLRAGVSARGALGTVPLVGRRRVRLDAQGTFEDL
ncbi:hypothetical protein [Streptomyces sp. NRRL S-37]|uniref:hypothetical protein n=1 Tax=Streptomyces sp. NRRL S-37 TaxID=1463903 RepID=UPI000A93D7C3|nr:hypothetical protein [Streptomyces sp. NRRL S-37]